MLRSSNARVFYVGTPHNHRVYGCFGNHTRVFLAHYVFFTSHGFHLYRLAGRFVAYSMEVPVSRCYCDSDRPWRLRVRDLATHETIYNAVTGDCCRPGLRDIVLSPRGGVAWIVRPSFESGQVMRHDARGTVVLDSGLVDPTSLTLDGTVLTWLRDGQEQRADLI